jgi:RimJ/RimL family protein N-acetyltransferase
VLSTTTERTRRDDGDMLFQAWSADGVLVGRLYVRLGPPEEPELAHFWPDTPLVENALVADGHRRQGIGTRLLAEAERWLRGQGRPAVALAVGVENKDARRLYERLGYQEWGTVLCRARGTAPGTPRAEPCVVMTKSLRQPHTDCAPSGPVPRAPQPAATHLAAPHGGSRE